MDNKVYIFDWSAYQIKEGNNKYLLYSNKRGKLLLVNSTGFFIINKLDGKHTLQDIIWEMAYSYGLEDKIVEEHVEKQIRDLLMNDLIYEETTNSDISDDIDIQRIYIEILKKQNGQIYLKDINVVKNIINRVLLETKEERVIVFIDCSEISSEEYLCRLFNIIESEKRLEAIIRIDYDIVNRELLTKMNFGRIKIVLPYFSQSIKDPFGEREILEEKISFFLEEKVPCYGGIEDAGNCSELCDIQQYAFDLGMTGIFLDDVDSEAAEKLENLYKNNMFLNSWKNNRIKRRDDIFVILMYKNFCQNTIQCIKNKIHCGIGREELYVDYDEYVYPCHRLKYDTFKYENMEKFFQKREFDFGQNIVAKKCKSCFAWTLCNGGCKAHNIAKKKPINSPAIICKTKKESIEKLFMN